MQGEGCSGQSLKELRLMGWGKQKLEGRASGLKYDTRWWQHLVAQPFAPKMMALTEQRKHCRQRPHAEHSERRKASANTKLRAEIEARKTLARPDAACAFQWATATLVQRADWRPNMRRC